MKTEEIGKENRMSGHGNPSKVTRLMGNLIHTQKVIDFMGEPLMKGKGSAHKVQTLLGVDIAILA
jgi:hypothetical protein